MGRWSLILNKSGESQVPNQLPGRIRLLKTWGGVPVGTHSRWVGYTPPGGGDSWGTQKMGAKKSSSKKVKKTQRDLGGGHPTRGG